MFQEECCGLLHLVGARARGGGGGGLEEEGSSGGKGERGGREVEEAGGRRSWKGGGGRGRGGGSGQGGVELTKEWVKILSIDKKDVFAALCMTLVLMANRQSMCC